MADIDRLVRPHLAHVKTYEPVDPPEVLAQRAGVPADQIIKLNGNENPYGASPRAIEAIVRAALHIYPDPLQQEVRRALGGYVGLEPDYLVAGAGADELIDLLLRLFVSPGDSIIECDPTFGMYSFFARITAAGTKSAPRDGLFEADVDAVKDAIDSTSKIIFVSSPNNPTGNVVSEEQVRTLVDTGLIVVVDEAYYEFCNQTVSGLVPEHENLVVLRTLSKWAGLAGIRVGYGIMSPTLVRHTIDIKPPYNISTAAEAALLASLEDSEALLQKVGLIVQERRRMFSLVSEIDGVKPWPSGGNYILCEFAPGRAQAVYNGLANRGIFVRRLSSERLQDHLRISVGTPEQTDAVVKALADLV